MNGYLIFNELQEHVIGSKVEGPLTLPFSLTLATVRGSSTPLRSAQNDKKKEADAL